MMRERNHREQCKVPSLGLQNGGSRRGLPGRSLGLSQGTGQGNKHLGSAPSFQSFASAPCWPNATEPRGQAIPFPFRMERGGEGCRERVVL